MAVFEVLFKNNAREVAQAIGAMNKNLNKFKGQVKSAQHELTSMIDKTPLKPFQDQLFEIANFFQPVFKRAATAINLIRAPLTNARSALVNVGSTQGLFHGLTAAVKAFGLGAMSSFSAATAAAASFTVAAGSILIPIAAIAAAVFTLKKVWDTNIGGMQTSFNRIFGRIMGLWSKFNVQFINFLQGFDGMFRNVFKNVEGLFNSIIPVVSGLVNIFFDLLKVFIPIGTVLANFNIGVFKTLFTILGALMPVLRFILNVLLIPIRITFMAILEGVKLLQRAFQWFKGTTAFDGVMKALQFMVDVWDIIFKAIMEFGQSLPEWAQNILGIKDIKLGNSAAAEGGGTTNRTSIINDNKRVTIMSNKEINKKGANGLASIMQQQSFVGI